MSKKGGFPIDYTTTKVVKEIQDELRKTLGVEVDSETIIKIVEGQTLSTVEGFKHGHTVVWKYFGTFIATDKRVKALNDSYARKGLTPLLVDTGFKRISFNKDGVLQD